MDAAQPRYPSIAEREYAEQERHRIEVAIKARTAQPTSPAVTRILANPQTPAQVAAAEAEWHRELASRPKRPTQTSQQHRKTRRRSQAPN